MPEYGVPVEISARHVHLSAEHLAVLFGAGAELKPRRTISQPGQFAAYEAVTVVGPKGELTARVVGPTRDQTQVELTTSECHRLGLPVVLRVSGSLAGTPGCTLVGPKGRVELSQGVIVAQRHLHASPEQAQDLGLKHGDIISIRTLGTRPVTFHDVVVRARAGADELSFMLDTDEANAAGLIGGDQGIILTK